MKQNKGFTLIELLAVIVILAIIALIAVPTILRVIEKSKEGAAKASALSYIEAIDLYNGTADLKENLVLKPNERYNLTSTTTVDGIGYLEINELVDIKGEKPTGLDDYVILSDTYKVIEGQMTFGDYIVIISGKDIKVIKNTNKVKPTDMTLNIEEETTMERGSATQIKVTFEPADTTNQKVTYEIDPSGIVTIDDNGNIKAVGYGDATITVTSKEDSSIKKTIKITVIQPENVKSITLEKEDKDLYVGGTIQLTAKLEPVDAISNAVTWTSSDENVAIVSESGLVNGISVGTAIITGTTVNGIEATLELEVKPVLAESITIEGEDTAFVGIESEYKATIKPDNTTDKTVTWSVSDNTVASIDSNGKVTGIKTGTVTITAKTSNGIEATKDITVEVPKKCVRATELHTETCGSDSANKCLISSLNELTHGNLGTKGTLSSGDAFDCDVNGDGKFDKDTERFYYMRDIDSDSDGVNETAALIYYINTTVNSDGELAVDYTDKSGNIEYYAAANENWHGPVTAISYLPTTTHWKNVSLTNTERTITGPYGELSTTGGTIENPFSYAGKAARLVTAQDINAACNITVASSSPLNISDTNCLYLMENLHYMNDSITARGYWLETPVASDKRAIWDLNSSFQIWTAGANTASFGVRPVIEVSKDDIEI